MSIIAPLGGIDHTSTRKLHVVLFFHNLTALDENNLDRISNRMI